MIFETEKIKKGTATYFSAEGEIINEMSAFRVKDSANEIALFITASDPGVELTIMGSNHVFGGCDEKFPLVHGLNVLLLDASTYVQLDGEYKGCILLHTGNVPCKTSVKEFC